MFSKLSKVFGGGKPVAPEQPLRDVAALLEPLAVPAIQIIRANDASPSRSFFGGISEIAGTLPRRGPRDAPLSLLAHIELAELHATMPVAWLPSAGALQFYYDMKNKPWGYDPRHRGGWAVVHAEEGRMPQAEMISSNDTTITVNRLTAPLLLRTPVTFRAVKSYPTWERSAVKALRLTEPELEVADSLGERQFGEKPQHQMLGFPQPVQHDQMELECQFASHGVPCGGRDWTQDPRAAGLAEGASDWRLLLQLDSDDNQDFVWEDAGRLYFFVREQDARAGNFDNTWIVLQCS